MLDFDYTHTIEIVSRDNHHKFSMSFGLCCIQGSSFAISASLSSPGEPAEPAEFELYQITFDVGKEYRVISRQHLEWWIGPDIVEELYQRTVQEAIESGDF